MEELQPIMIYIPGPQVGPQGKKNKKKNKYTSLKKPHLHPFNSLPKP